MIERLVLPAELAAEAEREARAALPSECCGLIEGTIEDETAHAFALHPARNLAKAPDRFEIDPAVQFALMRRLRGTERSVIGCYHSHPNGRAEPSHRDREGGGEKGFVWLIAALEGGAIESAAFIREGDHLREIALVVED